MYNFIFEKIINIQIYHLNLSCDTSVTSGLDSSRPVCGLQKNLYKFQLYIIITVYNEFNILQNIHFVNNLGEHDPADKLRNIRPWLFKFL